MTVVAKPTYTSIPLEIMVDRPAADVWKRIGKYCDIGEWFRIPCTITQGKDGEFGAVRSVANEILVGKTELSYTYTQPVRAGRPYDLYHGTLEARPVTATTSKLVYTLVYDNSMQADDAASAADRAAPHHHLHDGAAEHEDPRRGRHASTGTASRRAAHRRAAIKRCGQRRASTMAPTAKPASAGGTQTLSIARGMLSDPPRDATIRAEPPTPPIAAPISAPFQIESRRGERTAPSGACLLRRPLIESLLYERLETALSEDRRRRAKPLLGRRLRARLITVGRQPAVPQVGFS